MDNISKWPGGAGGRIQISSCMLAWTYTKTNTRRWRPTVSGINCWKWNLPIQEIIFGD